MQASFTPDGDRLVPTPTAASPWSDEMVNGHHIGGLVPGASSATSRIPSSSCPA